MLKTQRVVKRVNSKVLMPYKYLSPIGGELGSVKGTMTIILHLSLWSPVVTLSKVD